MNPGQMVAQLEKYGFSAIYVNRGGLNENGDRFLQALNEAAGGGGMIESDAHDMVCVILKPSSSPVLP